MSKKNKILLPFALYEELENMDQLNPLEMKAFLMSLRRYCDSTGRDFNKVCKELELEEPTWSGKLTPRQIEALDQGCKSQYTYSDSKDATWSINPETGLVDIVGSFYAARSSYIANTKSLMGIKFGKIEGDFSANSIGLETLEGCPIEVTGLFQASNNKFVNLKGCPIKIGKTLYLSNNSDLRSLEGSPEEIGGDFSIDSCRSLTSLEGSPKKIGGSMNCSGTAIKDLKGAPKEIGGNSSSVTFSAEFCYSLVSLEDRKSVV